MKLRVAPNRGHSNSERQKRETQEQDKSFHCLYPFDGYTRSRRGYALCASMYARSKALIFV
jgi:hypothetical protein